MRWRKSRRTRPGFAGWRGTIKGRSWHPGRTTVLRGVEEKLEYVAAGHGIIVLPLSATRHYTRPDVVYVPVTDTAPDEVLLAAESSRRSRLITAFAAAAREVAAEDPDVTVVEALAA